MVVKSGKTLQWNEPWFFKLRSLTTTGWILRGVFVLATYLGFVVLMSIDRGSVDGPRFGLAEILLLPALVAGSFFVLLELPTAQRNVQLTENDITCTGNFMMFGGMLQMLVGIQQWNWRGIKEIQLLRPHETNNPYAHGLMVVTPKYARSRTLAVPTTVELESLANQVHKTGVAVLLSEWRPATTADVTP
jgi:hypothetical protein